MARPHSQPQDHGRAATWLRDSLAEEYGRHQAAQQGHNSHNQSDHRSKPGFPLCSECVLAMSVCDSQPPRHDSILPPRLLHTSNRPPQRAVHRPTMCHVAVPGQAWPRGFPSPVPRAQKELLSPPSPHDILLEPGGQGVPDASVERDKRARQGALWHRRATRD